MRLVIVMAAVVLSARMAGAQTDAVPGVAHGASRAAGMPLRDGALAPGMLTVRVVRGSFDNNLPDQAVQVEQGGGTTSARTGADGRAQFAHMPIGATVRVSALVDGERLASDEFVMPPEAGIRVLLIAGGGDAPASGVFGDASAAGGGPAATLAAPEPAAVAPAPAPAAPASPSPDSALLVIRVVLSGATLVALAVVVRRLRRPPRL